MTRRLAFALPVALCHAVALAPARSAASEEKPVYLDEARSVDERALDLLKRLSLDEKLLLVHADSKVTTAAVPHLGRFELPLTLEHSLEVAP